jgi:hypothetical protein
MSGAKDLASTRDLDVAIGCWSPRPPIPNVRAGLRLTWFLAAQNGTSARSTRDRTESLVSLRQQLLTGQAARGDLMVIASRLAVSGGLADLGRVRHLEQAPCPDVVDEAVDRDTGRHQRVVTDA